MDVVARNDTNVFGDLFEDYLDRMVWHNKQMRGAHVEHILSAHQMLDTRRFLDGKREKEGDDKHVDPRTIQEMVATSSRLAFVEPDSTSPEPQRLRSEAFKNLTCRFTLIFAQSFAGLEEFYIVTLSIKSNFNLRNRRVDLHYLFCLQKLGLDGVVNGKKAEISAKYFEHEIPAKQGPKTKVSCAGSRGCGKFSLCLGSFTSMNSEISQ